MRRMSFNMTQAAMRERRKTVTRRVGWIGLNRWHQLLAVSALRQPKDKVEIFGVIEVVDVRIESIGRILELGYPETEAEGFLPGHPLHEPRAFVDAFCRVHDCGLWAPVKRIEFRFVEEAAA